MNQLKNLNSKLNGILFLILLLLVINTSACERLAKITIENQRNQDVTIYYTVVDNDGTLGESTYQGTILANSTKAQTIILIQDDDVKRIEAKDPSGKTVFSHDYNRAGLEKIGWKITIPP